MNKPKGKISIPRLVLLLSGIYAMIAAIIGTPILIISGITVLLLAILFFIIVRVNEKHKGR